MCNDGLMDSQIADYKKTIVTGSGPHIGTSCSMLFLCFNLHVADDSIAWIRIT